ncbi:hypothetical protein ACTVZO_37400 [Streptomyces sp. IBSNAI002]|uniref:hypothetical protein n=1 Tax=Streptomyces sp. IBSNAI002 TaxID=3457500 RepID=UPI003FD45CB3
MTLELMGILAPAVVAVIGLVLRCRHGSSSHWDVLHELARGRVRTGLERERRATLRVILDRMPDSTPATGEGDGRGEAGAGTASGGGSGHG